MQVRFAVESDKTAVKDLWSYSFHDSSTYVDYYFSHRYRKENNLVLEEDGEVKASLLINPYELCVGGSRKKVSYIVGVSVFPQYRGEGYSSQILKRSLRILKDRGEELVLLMPIDTAIYRRYGFINTFFQDSFSIRVKGRSAVPSTLRIRKASSPTDLKELCNLYQSEMKSKYAYIRREEEDFRIRLDEMKREGGEGYFILDGQDKVGYFLFFPTYQENIGLVQELTVPGKAAVIRVLNFLYQHQTQFEKVIVQPVNKELFWTSLEFDNQVKVETSPFMMARVLDAKECIRQYLSFEKETVIEVEDALIEENRSFYLWKDGEVKKLHDEKRPQLRLTVEALTMLVMGTADPALLLKTDMAECLDPSRMGEFSRTGFRRENYSNDYV